MSVIATNEHQITLFCHSQHHLTTKCIAVAEASKAELQVIEIDKTKVTATEWTELADKLNLSLDDLLVKNHPDFEDKFNSNSSLSEEDAIKLLQNNPELLVYPIALRGGKAVLAKNSTAILQLHKPDSKDAKLP